jgi:hypothetical protein
MLLNFTFCYIVCQNIASRRDLPPAKGIKVSIYCHGDIKLKKNLTKFNTNNTLKKECYFLYITLSIEYR